MTKNNGTSEPSQKKSGGCLKTLGIIILTVIVTVALSYWLMSRYLFPSSFEPVALGNKEESVLVNKLRQFGIEIESPDKQAGEPLVPEVYSEVGAKREVSFTERELNSLIAKNTDLANKVAIDLANDLVSARVLIPLDQDFPILGGKTLKASAGAQLAFENGRPVVVLKGVSVWGVPIPNAWLGDLKNVDLIKEFGADEGFWQSFAAGVEHIEVIEGHLKIKLKE